MKKQIMIGVMGTLMMTGCSSNNQEPKEDAFDYTVEQFADLQLLRYKVHGFEELPLEQKKLVYYLSEAALQGRDILFDQNGKYNLIIRKMLETVYTDYQGDRNEANFKAMETYLKRVWFSNGIHHHYAADKFVPGFTPEFFKQALESVDVAKLPLAEGETLEALCNEVFPVIFDAKVMAKRVNQADGEDLVLTSASNYYDGLTQQEAEEFYAKMKTPNDTMPVMYGMNSRLVKENGRVYEKVWKSGGLYGQAIEKVVYWLEKAQPFAENESQANVIARLIDYYRSGDLKTFDDYSILWLQDTLSQVDFVNGFTESYGDPLGMKASWEALVNFKNIAATERAEKLSLNAQWFEDNAPIADEYKKEECKGVSAKVITAAILAGDLYPSTAIGINLPNADWIRKEYGSKSVTISNITKAYSLAAEESPKSTLNEFAYDEQEIALAKQYLTLTGDIHTDLHECLGHGSGQLLPTTPTGALGEYSSTLEEARADLFGLYYLGDPKMVEIGLIPSLDLAKAQYADYIMNGMMTQFSRIELGKNVEESHMRNRKLIAEWCYEKGKKNNVIEWVKQDGKSYIVVNDFDALRRLFGELLKEVQRIKSTGDYEAGRKLVEDYAVKIDYDLHKEVLERYAKLNLEPYSGFVNPDYELVEKDGEIVDVKIVYKSDFTEQMLHYSKEWSFLPSIN